MDTQITVAQGGSIPSLPPRLAWLAGSVGTVQHPGQPVRYNLPKGWEVTEAERAEASNLLSTLTSALDPEATFEEQVATDAKAVLFTKMLHGFAGAADLSDVKADAKFGVYADAVIDLPAWAIDAALKRWARGSCPADVEEKPRFAFPPAPATFRALALLETAAPRRHAKLLTNLLAALPLEQAMDPTPIEKVGVPVLRRM